jgi:hypothetical protein
MNNESILSPEKSKLVIDLTSNLIQKNLKEVCNIYRGTSRNKVTQKLLRVCYYGLRLVMNIIFVTSFNNIY